MTVDETPMARAGALAEYDSARRPHPALEEIQELVRYRELLWLWSLRNLTLRYKRSVLGILWSLLEPLMMMAILSIVFTALFRFSVVNYPIYVLAGLLLWDFFGRSTNQMIDEMIASQPLAARIYTPRSAFALAAVITQLVNWALALIPLLVIMLVMSVPFSWAILTLPLSMLLTGLFAVGVGLTVATIGAFFHDVKLIYQVLVTAWFYATPIIYPIDIVPEAWRRFFVFNPLFHLSSLVREPVFEGRLPAPESWLIGAAVSIGSALVGWWLFTGRRDRLGYL